MRIIEKHCWLVRIPDVKEWKEEPQTICKCYFVEEKKVVDLLTKEKKSERSIFPLPWCNVSYRTWRMDQCHTFKIEVKFLDKKLD